MAWQPSLEDINSSCYYSDNNISWSFGKKIRRIYSKNIWENIISMKKKTFLIFSTYIWTKTLLGLTFHPFSTIREVTRRPVLLPIIFSPLIGLITLFIFGRIGSFLIHVYGLKRQFISLILSVSLISILFWQALLIYLLISFLFALWRR